MVFQITIFIISIFVLSWLSSRLVAALVQVAKYLRWREFIIAFFVMAFAASLPNLFVDINAAMQGMPEVAFGDIVGGNLVDLTVVMAIAVFFGRKPLSAESEMVQKSAIFTAIIAVLPLLLVFDKSLDRGDGIILLLAFFIYSLWLFSKEERFKKIYKGKTQKLAKGFFSFLKDLVKIIVFLVLLLVSSFIVVSSAQFFSEQLGMSLSLVGVLIIGLGNCFPEIYFSIISAKKSENWMILGDLMGAVIVSATLVLGIIALIFPFQIKDFSPFLIARMFLIIASIIFVIAIKTNRKITKKEGIVLFFVYIMFLASELLKSFF